MRCAYCGCYTTSGFTHPACVAAADRRRDRLSRRARPRVTRAELLLAAATLAALAVLAAVAWRVA